MFGGRSQCAILIPSCDRYAALARLTGELIDSFWTEHPPVHFAGIAEAQGEDRMPVRREPGDWIGIVRDACANLADRGFTSAYLILDDHPPLERCHARHLNQTLPALLDELQASCIGLNGWARFGRAGRLPVGEILDGSRAGLERLPELFRWRFSLHPALWRLRDLVALLDEFLARFPAERRTPWLFERRASELSRGAGIGAAYRVCGRRMTAKRARWLRNAARIVLLRAARKAMALVSAEDAARTLGQKFHDAAQYYEGPYPLYWSGIMTAGRPNLNLLRFLDDAGRRSLRAIIARVVAPLAAGGN